MKRFGIVVVSCILLLVPVAVMAQDKITELVFSADGSKFTMKKTLDNAYN